MFKEVISILLLSTHTSITIYQPLQNLTGSTEKVNTLDISGDNSKIILGSQDQKTYLYNLSSAAFSLTHKYEICDSSVNAVDITDDGEWLLIVCS